MISIESDDENSTAVSRSTFSRTTRLLRGAATDSTKGVSMAASRSFSAIDALSGATVRGATLSESLVNRSESAAFFLGLLNRTGELASVVAGGVES